MPTISTTTLDVLERRMVPIIEAIVPRIVYQGAEAWKHYTKAAATPSRSRRFTLRWVPGPFVEGGYYTNNAVDASAVLAVVTDYAGQHENLLHLVQDDWLQIRYELSNGLTADTTSGLISIFETKTPPNRVSSTARSRVRLSDVGGANSNTFQINLTYDVEFHQAV